MLTHPPVINTIAEMRTTLAAARQAGKTIGFVPTMGALHAGHAALIRTARTRTDFVVVSIFVNPTQFGPNEDLDKYPRTLDADRQLCAAVGTDAIFAPSPKEMYPDGFSTFVEVHGLQDVLCGLSRPGHFRGVATVVLKLFNIIEPFAAFFGQKDAQQASIIRRMVRDLDVAVKVEVLPTIREADGLAMSSRNRYLDPQQRQQAAGLFRALEAVRTMVASGERDVTHLESHLASQIATLSAASLDYAKILDAESLRPIEKLERPALAALAVFFGSTRLIDNTILTP